MACYRKGGCGPYENRSCNECPASKPEYADRYKNQTDTQRAVNVKVFINKDGIISALTDAGVPVSIEVINETAIQNATDKKTAEMWTEAYMCQLCGDGYKYIDDAKMTDRP
jgi:post-segregation antitoxin (ccd killing protein)